MGGLGDIVFGNIVLERIHLEYIQFIYIYIHIRIYICSYMYNFNMSQLKNLFGEQKVLKLQIEKWLTDDHFWCLAQFLYYSILCRQGGPDLYLDFPGTEHPACQAMPATVGSLGSWKTFAFLQLPSMDPTSFPTGQFLTFRIHPYVHLCLTFPT